MAKPDWCHRSTFLRIKGIKTKKDVAPHTLRAEAIFAEGNAIHRKWQTWTAEMGILWGMWECVICQECLYEWSDNLPTKDRDCLRGLDHQWEYREVPLQDDYFKIAGHADGIINPTNEESLILEAKSVGPGTLRKLDLLHPDEHDDDSYSKFSSITRPMSEHFLQAQIYLRLAQSEKITSHVGPISRGLVLYEHKADQQIREFPITYSPRWTDALFEAAADIAWAIDNDRNIGCLHRGCSQCELYVEED